MRGMGDTIFALASGSGRAGVAVIRMSGAQAGVVLKRLAGATPEPRRAALHALRDSDGDVIDQALVLWFPRPRSFTGEDVAEFHVHGGAAVLARMTRVLSEQTDVRMAEPGEFTKRAVLNGKMDLTQAEGLADLIDAQTEAQRRQARRHLEGALGARFQTWRDRLVRAMAFVEAQIDFPDEDIPEEADRAARDTIVTLKADIAEALHASAQGARLREGVRVALIGKPNAGKSSFFNAMVGSARAIVTDQAGTTRDVLEAALDWGGVPVILTDAAGLRSTENVVEKEGVARAEATAHAADLRILIWDLSDGAPDPRLRAWLTSGDLMVGTKSDLVSGGQQGVTVSHVTGDGLDVARERIGARVRELAWDEEAPVMTRERHRAASSDALAALETALEIWDKGPELVGEELRRAADALGRALGRVDLDEILDVVFREFCLGK